MGFAKDEFRTAFDKIGYRWSSKSQFELAPEPFLGKFYASYVDRRTNLTFYFRNHELVDTTLEQLLEIGNANLQEIGDPHFGESGNPISGNRQSRSLGIGNPDILYTETTTEITTEINSELLQDHSDVVETPHSSPFQFPPNLDISEQQSILRLISNLDTQVAQTIIDEIAGIRRLGKIRQSPISLASSIVKRAKEGQFHPAVALDIATRRTQEQQRHEEENERAKLISPKSKEKKQKSPEYHAGHIKKTSEK